MSDLSGPETASPDPAGAAEPAAVAPVAAASPPAPEPAQEPAQAAPARRRGTVLPALTSLGFLVLLGAFGFLWHQNDELRRQVGTLAYLSPDRVDALGARLNQVAAQVADLAARPAPAVPGLTALEQRLRALEHRPPPSPAPDLTPLEARVAALEGRPASNPADPALEAKVASLQAALAQTTRSLEAAQRQAVDKLQAAQQQALQSLQTAHQADLAGLQAAQAQAQQAQQAKVASLEAAQQATARQADAAAQAARASAARAAELQRVQEAQAALQAGKPLGDLPGAPPALARFATVAPPTEAALRLAYPAAARAAAAASEPSGAGLSLLQRMWQHAQTLVTVRRGDQVVVGAPSSAILAVAQGRLDAGDLAGAVAALARLDPATAHAMTQWREQAQALLDARATLAHLAGAG